MGELFVQIGSEDFSVIIRVEAAYSPDLLDDICTRAVRDYRTLTKEEAVVEGGEGE